MTSRSLALLLVFALPAFRQDPAPPADAPKVDREAEAEKLFNEAVALEKDGKYADAAEAFRKMRKEYGFTTSFGLKNYNDIGKHLKACGLKIAEAGLKEQKLTKEPHIDGINGLEFNPPEGWRGVPPQKAFTDRRITDMMGSMDMEKMYKGEIDKVARYTSTYLEELYLVFYKVYGPESLKDVESIYDKFLEQRNKGIKVKSTAAIKHPSNHVSKVVHELEKGGEIISANIFEPSSKFGFVIAAVWESAEVDADATVTAGSSELLQTLIENVAKSFVVIKKAALEGYKKKYNNGARATGWRAYKSDNFLFEYNAEENWVKTLAEHLETIQKVYRKAIPTSNKIPMCVVKVFPNQEDFLYYSGAYGAAAYWSPAQEEIVCYQFTGGDVKTDTGVTKKITNRLEAEDVTFRILYHEGFHQYMYYAMGKTRDLYIPSWLNEGMGDYFFGGKFNLLTGKKTFEVGLNSWRLDVIRNAVKAKKHVPVDKILSYRQQDYYANAGLCYAEGWALCHFLVTHKDKKYNQFVSKFIDELRKNDDYKAVTTKVIKELGIDLGKLEAEWKEYVIGLKTDPPPPDPKKPDAPKPPEPEPDPDEPAPPPAPPDER